MNKSSWAILLSCALVGCDMGHEIAGVGSANAVRRGDGRVAVTADLTCMLVSGESRVDGRCDADGSSVCIDAQWFTADQPSEPFATATGCAYLNPVEGFPFVVTSSRVIPGNVPMTIVLATAGQDEVMAPLPKSVSISSP